MLELRLPIVIATASATISAVTPKVVITAMVVLVMVALVTASVPTPLEVVLLTKATLVVVETSLR